MFVIDTQSKLPIFEQLKKQILEFITIGILSPNDKLPSVRAMASQIGVNPNTVGCQSLSGAGGAWIYLFGERKGMLCGRQ